MERGLKPKCQHRPGLVFRMWLVIPALRSFDFMRLVLSSFYTHNNKAYTSGVSTCICVKVLGSCASFILLFAFS